MVNRVATYFALTASMVVAAAAPKPTLAQGPIVQVVNIVVNDVTLEAGQLIADATVTLDILGREVTQNVDIPLSLSASPGAAGQCDILHLSVGPLHLDLLGQVVDLDDCDGGPVVIDINGDEDQLLGALLCGIAGLLNDSLNLGDILGGLTDANLALLTGGIRDILNAVLADFFDNAVASQPGNGHGNHGRGHLHHGHGNGNGHEHHQCDILNLAVPEGLQLDVLGLVVETSPICLDVYAQEGANNLLGNLLCAIVNLPRGGLPGLINDVYDLLDLLGL